MDSGQSDSDLMAALLSGLADDDRSQTAELIRVRGDEEREAALKGHPERNVDVGPRQRASRAAPQTDLAGA